MFGGGKLTTQILLFPMRKRVGQIRRWAATIATYPKPESREKNIQRHLATVADRCRRVGLDEAAIQHEVYTVETALRHEILRLQRLAAVAARSGRTLTKADIHYGLGLPA
jgi:uncharacterized protein DUF6074